MKPSKTLCAFAVLAGVAIMPLNIAIADDETPVQESVEAATTQSSWYGKPYALNGQDVVSFRSEGGPVKGAETYTVEYDNTEWRFASEENRELFLENPDQYIPQFGGYCPVALARGDLKIGSAEHFNIVDDKLYVNYDKSSSERFGTDATGYIAAAKLNF